MSSVLTEPLVMSRFARSCVVALVAALVTSVAKGSGLRTTGLRGTASLLSTTLTVTLALSAPVVALTHTVRAVSDRGGMVTVTVATGGTGILPDASVKLAATFAGATIVSWYVR